MPQKLSIFCCPNLSAACLIRAGEYDYRQSNWWESSSSSSLESAARPNSRRRMLERRKMSKSQTPRQLRRCSIFSAATREIACLPVFTFYGRIQLAKSACSLSMSGRCLLPTPLVQLERYYLPSCKSSSVFCHRQAKNCARWSPALWQSTCRFIR